LAFRTFGFPPVARQLCRRLGGKEEKEKELKEKGVILKAVARRRGADLLSIPRCTPGLKAHGQVRGGWHGDWGKGEEKKSNEPEKDQTIGKITAIIYRKSISVRMMYYLGGVGAWREKGGVCRG